MDILFGDVLRTQTLPQILKINMKQRAEEKKGKQSKSRERKGKSKIAEQRGEKEGKLVGVCCLRMIQSKLTSHQPCHQQKSTEEKDERR